jgi:hypothetical protein
MSDEQFDTDAAGEVHEDLNLPSRGLARATPPRHETYLSSLRFMSLSDFILCLRHGYTTSSSHPYPNRVCADHPRGNKKEKKSQRARALAKHRAASAGASNALLKHQLTPPSVS